MKIGMNMLLWTDHVSEQHLPIIEKIKTTGFDGIEIPLGSGDKAYYSQLGSQIADLGLDITCVTSLLEEFNIVSTDKKIREAGLDRLKWAIDMAHALGAELIGGPIHSAFAYFTKQPPTPDEKKWSVEYLRKAGDYAAQANIELTPEALNRFECYLVNTMAGIKEILDEVNHPSVGAMYDSHHANIEEKSHYEAVQTIAPHLKHVHISENNRGTPGKGLVDWDAVFKALKAVNYDRWLTIEAFSTTIPEFANAINVWRDYAPIDEIYQEGYAFVKQKWNEL